MWKNAPSFPHSSHPRGTPEALGKFFSVSINMVMIPLKTYLLISSAFVDGFPSFRHDALSLTEFVVF